MVDNVDINKQIDVTTGEKTQEEAEEKEYAPLYQVYPHSKIPVSKVTGTFWEQRFKEAKAHLAHTKVSDRWTEAIAYYQNDQGGRSNKRGQLGEVGNGKSDTQYATENVVFTNVSALIPAIYAKNPDVELTATKDVNEAKAKLFEALIDTILKRKFAPGINLKPKLKRATCSALLTNICYLELSYNKKEDSSEEALEALFKCSKELETATNTKEIAEAEGKLMALEDKISLLAAAGPKCRVVQPNMVIRDPAANEIDFSDSNFVIIGEYIKTSFLRAVYGTRNEEDMTSQDDWKSLYEPTHSLATSDTSTGNAQGHDQQINTFSLGINDTVDELDLSTGADNSGFKTAEEKKNRALTLVWYVWDKTTRRVLMFHDKNWKYPIWVWDDPYKLSRFFPLFPLQFHTDPTDVYGRSEVMYYLDQQDEINMSNLEVARMRHWAMTKVFYDTNAMDDKRTLENFLSNNTDNKMFGVKLPEGKKLQDIISTFPAPSAQFSEMFSNQRSYDAINRLSSVTPIMQNVQFKTNTTNKAVESYESSTAERLDEKIDAVEEVVGDLGWAIIEMCAQFMPEETVKTLVPEEVLANAGGWEVLEDPSSLIKDYNFAIVGGSTLKPTSRVKKEQAMQLGQVLGQFASVSPAVVVVMLKALERAFSEDFVVTEEEWKMVVDGTMQALQGGGGQPQGEGQQPKEGGNETQQVFQQVEQMLLELPPEERKVIGDAIGQGVPLQEIMSRLTGAGQQEQQAQQTQQPMQ